MEIIATVITAITAVAVVMMPIILKGEIKTCKREQINEIKGEMDILRGELLRTRIIIIKEHPSPENKRLILQIYDEILKLRLKANNQSIGNGYTDEIIKEVKEKW